MKDKRTSPTPFFGRHRELKLLRRLREKRSASLVVLKGRRRIGKSRLAQEFGKDVRTLLLTGLPPSHGLTAQEQREDFAEQMRRILNIPLPRADEWGDLFWALANEVQNGPVLIILDEISWMGSKDPMFLGKLKNAWDLNFKNNPQLILVLSGSVSSWIDRNIVNSAGFFGRVSLNMTLAELPLNECTHFWGPSQMNVSAFEKFKMLAVTGGVPRYLEEVIPHLPAEENIRQLCFQEEGLLVNEFDSIFSDLFSRRSEIYKKIVTRLAKGAATLEHIYEAIGIKKSGFILEYLEDLDKAGFISRDYSWNLKNGKGSRFSQFRLSDNYVRFYLKHIQPVRSKIGKQPLSEIPGWHTIMGLQFENLVLNNRHQFWQALQLDPQDIVCNNPYFQKKNRKQDGCQIDYLIQEQHGSLYPCEIKFSSAPVTTKVIDEIEEKVQWLNVPRHMSVRPVLVHVNGVTDSVRDSNYFANIVDFSDLLT